MRTCTNGVTLAITMDDKACYIIHAVTNRPDWCVLFIMSTASFGAVLGYWECGGVAGYVINSSHVCETV